VNGVVLFAAGDVGGARALIPVINLCDARGIPFVVLEHGYLKKEWSHSWGRFLLSSDGKQVETGALFKKEAIGVVVFSSSVSDSIALSLAREAKEAGVPVIHVLDSWTGYRSRMEVDGLPAFTPDFYTAMDDLALSGAARDGIDSSILVKTGQPALAFLRKDYESWLKKMNRVGLDGGRAKQGQCSIVFVSEPVERDQGASSSSARYRGYTEKDVMPLFCKALQPFADRVCIELLPHPREVAEDVRDLWHSHKGGLKGGLSRADNGKEAVFGADGVAGMASILLYEAWLLGKPVLSLQPGLRLAPLRMLEKRDGVEFVDDSAKASSCVERWLARLGPHDGDLRCADLETHEQAGQRIVALILQCMEACGRKGKKS
jgi:hypothetical protein